MADDKKRIQQEEDATKHIEAPGAEKDKPDASIGNEPVVPGQEYPKRTERDRQLKGQEEYIDDKSNRS